MIADLGHQTGSRTGAGANAPAWDDAGAAAAWLRSRDEAAAAWLVTTYAALVLRIAKARLRGYDGVEDAVQAAWMAAFRGLERYDSRRPFAAWLARITLNECRDAIRARSRRRVFCAADLGLEHIERLASAPVSSPPFAERMEKEREEYALELLASLPARDREAFSLYHGRNMSSAEVAARLGIQPGHVRLRVFRAQQMLRRRILAFSCS
jgi:RNA polymerase sigma-70 factor (ECF subfamily)